MKKTSTRLATIGGVIVLGACAIALAQRDSRQREREQPTLNAFASQPATPIAVSEEQWDVQKAPLAEPIVRGNNDHNFVAYESDGVEQNPLRSGGDSDPSMEFDPPSLSNELPTELPNSLPNVEMLSAAILTADMPRDGAVVQASAMADEAGDGPPAWLSQPRPGPLPTNADAAATGATVDDAEPNQPPMLGLPQPPSAMPSTSAASSALPSNALPRPSFDATPRSLSPNNAGPLPQMPSSAPASSTPADRASSNGWPAAASSPNSSGQGSSPSGLPSGPSSGTASDLSDTQRGALPPTSFPPASLPQAMVSDHSTMGRTGPMNNAPTNDAAMPTPRNGMPPAGSASGGVPSSVASPRSAATSPMSNAASAGGGYARTASAALVSDEPGNRYLDGSQNPILQIEKRAPEEIQVGKKASFVIIVRNSGNATAYDVTVVDKVPRGARFAAAEPSVTPMQDGVMTWGLGEIAAGDERTIKLDIVPEIEGEVGSVASVYSAARASVRTLATMPKLELTLESSPEVLIGGYQQVIVNIRNVGTGVARGVRLEADVPKELRHESGVAQLEAPLGDLAPNQTIRIETLAFTAVQPGKSACVVRAIAADDMQVEESAIVDVRAPELTARIDGPKLRFLDRPATYRFTVSNNGTAAATNLDFVVRLPAGLKFVNADKPQANFDPQRNTVSLGLHELAAGQSAPFDVTVVPVNLGPQAFSLSATGDLGVTAEAAGQVAVEGLAELDFSIDQDNGSIEVGATTTYSVVVANVGNKPDRNVQLAVQLPSGAKLVNVAAQVNYQQQGDMVLFEPVAEMAIRDRRTFRIEVQHNEAGTRVVRTKLMSQNLKVGVVKEEGTFVYDDTNQ